MRPFLDRLKSRKLIMALLAGVIASLQIYFPDLPSDAINNVVYCLLGYVGVEGVVDAFGQLSTWIAGKAIEQKEQTAKTE
jgi:cbb3-type cytochrome oxidase subunit 1